MRALKNKLSLDVSKTIKVYRQQLVSFGFPTEQSQNSDPTTSCTSSITTTHVFNR